MTDKKWLPLRECGLKPLPLPFYIIRSLISGFGVLFFGTFQSNTNDINDMILKELDKLRSRSVNDALSLDMKKIAMDGVAARDLILKEQRK